MVFAKCGKKNPTQFTYIKGDWLIVNIMTSLSWRSSSLFLPFVGFGVKQVFSVLNVIPIGIKVKNTDLWIAGKFIWTRVLNVLSAAMLNDWGLWLQLISSDIYIYFFFCHLFEFILALTCTVCPLLFWYRSTRIATVFLYSLLWTRAGQKKIICGSALKITKCCLSV